MSAPDRDIRVLIAGAGGMLGRDAVDAITARGHTVIGLARAELDITDAHAVEDAIGDLRPDVVVNCAAWTDVDGAEASERAAMEVNDQPASTAINPAGPIARAQRCSRRD